eukprot:CAMPEP_0198522132 /NCGR_PEP_ID=MMETSP1462-20131121/21354_1 /TAXON_ID=1333877 /ORGANISM="Brandtodinium nutriculum, Strain RCC3387" /LENGTH=175 /DNA_ID=CAMNT_0044251789 /DNA_START=84 /DNA_END=607 /DNA_ORIENTATION=+
MYDVCQHMLLPEVTCFDASYAELCTDWGPANIFISHVWAESAGVTHDAIQKLAVALELKGPSDASLSGPMGSGDGPRVWFCTACNNQSRVQCELGDKVLSSPFAQVVRNSLCATVLIVSPLRALERKWCTFEFCFAGTLDKEVLMLTEDGVVQEGHVTPQALHGLAERLVDFECR